MSDATEPRHCAIVTALRAAGCQAPNPPKPSTVFGCLKPRRPGRGPYRLLTDDMVRAIRRVYADTSVSTYALADEYNVTHDTIWKVIARKTYRDVEDIPA